MTDLPLGITGEAKIIVSDENTAKHMGSGAAVVFSTPSLVALMERASIAAVHPYLPPEQTTVGFEVKIKHIAPTPLGMTVTARAELVAVDGHKLTFKVEAIDEQKQVGMGTHRRAIVDLQSFGRETSP
ncbi:MAG: thioesterase family protein [Chloroflexi bacterium]|nr:thioesterase family protein [Chloroflexota bacterium]